MHGWREMSRRFRHPVRPETRRNLAEATARLDPELRVAHQTIGRMEEGCGATIGDMPRCDFGCTGCYLGANANATPELPVEEIKDQMRALRTRLGRWGNLQLTDGEVTLRPETELIELLRFAREVELIPMVMSHGETFRRRPGLLERLMVEGGLVELSIHVDITQRGRDGGFDGAASELDLMPLRDEFAQLVRSARRRTGLPLRVATTCTVIEQNLADVGAVVGWAIDNADAFRIVSFQPAAQVGRSRAGLGGGVTQDDVWEQIVRGVLGGGASDEQRRQWLDQQWWFGHPGCSRLITGLVARQPREASRFALTGPRGPEPQRRFFERFLDRWGGVSFRSGSRPVLAAQIAGMLCRTPGLFAVALPRLGGQVLGDLAPGRAGRLLARLLTGRARLHPFTLGTHEFMSREQIETPLGRERLRNCIFTVPIDGEFVSMCEVNALGVRDRFYDRAAGRSAAPGEPLVPVTVSAP